jgi:hypothetical protein
MIKFIRTIRRPAPKLGHYPSPFLIDIQAPLDAVIER